MHPAFLGAVLWWLLSYKKRIRKSPVQLNRGLLLLLALIEIDDHIHTVFNAQFAGVQANVIILGGAPGTAGVVLVVDLTALILFG